MDVKMLTKQVAREDQSEETHGKCDPDISAGGVESQYVREDGDQTEKPEGRGSHTLVFIGPGTQNAALSAVPGPQH